MSPDDPLETPRAVGPRESEPATPAGDPVGDDALARPGTRAGIEEFLDRIRLRSESTSGPSADPASTPRPSVSIHPIGDGPGLGRRFDPPASRMPDGGDVLFRHDVGQAPPLIAPAEAGESEYQRRRRQEQERRSQGHWLVLLAVLGFAVGAWGLIAAWRADARAGRLEATIADLTANVERAHDTSAPVTSPAMAAAPAPTTTVPATSATPAARPPVAAAQNPPAAAAQQSSVAAKPKPAPSAAAASSATRAPDAAPGATKAPAQAEAGPAVAQVPSRPANGPVAAPAQSVADPSTASWTINLASYPSPPEANAHVGRLRSLGLDAAVRAVVRNGKTWHRVSVGSFPSRQAALDYLEGSRRNVSFAAALTDVWIGKP